MRSELPFLPYFAPYRANQDSGYHPKISSLH